MKKSLLLIIFSPFIVVCSFAISSNLSGVINKYAAVTTIFPGICNDSVQVATTTGFNQGDTVLIIQMQGATSDSTNTSSFGTILSYGSCGNFEFLKIAFINGNIIHFTAPLQKTYSVSGAVQLVKIPHYINAAVTGTVSAQPWNGSTGGVFALSVRDTLKFNADIDLTGTGFRGGSASPNYYLTWDYDFYMSISPGRGGEKGEGIVPYFLNKEYGRGAQANGGGGGNDTNTGAAGGGNYGAGGHGGNNYFAPDTLWGLASKSLANSIINGKLFLGGGGGGGQQNNNEGTAGTNGGGILVLSCGTIIGNNFNIKSNGADNTVVAGIDGAGGGGAGGSILLNVSNFSSTINVQANGGKGGDQQYPPQCHGNGGGGGGGVIVYPGASLPGNVLTSTVGGVKGVGVCNGSPNDAAHGAGGTTIFNWMVPTTFLPDAGPDQTICKGEQVQIGTPAQNGLTYSWNNGAGNIANPYVSPLVTTTYILTVNSGTCGNLYDTVTIYVDSAQLLTTSDTSICFGSSVQLAASGGLTYSWAPSAGLSNDTIATPIATPMATTSYTATVTTTNGCNDFFLCVVTVYPDPPTPLITQSNDTLFCATYPSFKSYQWYFNYAPQAGATDTFLVISQSGNYNVQVIDTNGCQISVGIILILGVNESESGTNISLYPVPVSDKMNIHLNRTADKAAVEIDDIPGRSIYKWNFDTLKDDILTLDLSALASGVYFISINMDGQKVVKKFIKQ